MKKWCYFYDITIFRVSTKTNPWKTYNLYGRSQYGTQSRVNNVFIKLIEILRKSDGYIFKNGPNHFATQALLEHVTWQKKRHFFNVMYCI